MQKQFPEQKTPTICSFHVDVADPASVDAVFIRDGQACAPSMSTIATVDPDSASACAIT